MSTSYTHDANDRLTLITEAVSTSVQTTTTQASDKDGHVTTASLIRSNVQRLTAEIVAGNPCDSFTSLPDSVITGT